MSAVHLDSGTGNIRLLGHGWDNAGSNAHIGISLDWGDTITAHGAGAITIIGVAGTGIDYNYGLNMDGSSGTNVITAEAGSTTLIGTANGTGQFNHGLILYNGNTVASIGGGAIQVTGTAAADRLKEVRIEIGEGEHPAAWQAVGQPAQAPVNAGVLAEIPAGSFRAAKVWTIRVVSTHANGRSREGRFILRLG